ncbi:MAG: S-adenosylhomocysteine deaminase [Saprospirales bacterium]|nr:MAG: S-adenosylhomocysteine deaminase [Saprospirales bacterium]
MKTRKITADRIYDGLGNCLKDKVIVFRDDGEIIDIVEKSQVGEAPVERYKGILTPGFINAHCHLELSHMKGLVDTGTGLMAFVKDVVTRRNAKEALIRQAIKDADREMAGNGIVAVGDVSNVSDSFQTKAESNIHYHTFVEMFDFLQKKEAQKHFDSYNKVLKELRHTYELPGNAVPHAPYSVSENLFKLLRDENRLSDHPVCMHNMETPSELDLFSTGAGEIVDLYEGFGMDCSDCIPKGFSPLTYALKNMDPEKTTVLVHNTLCGSADIKFAEQWARAGLYWVTCPSANLYIENRLPRYEYFKDAVAKMAIGTDSLTSNWTLSVLDEMKVIAKYQSMVGFEELIQWATFNGAAALKLGDKIGSLEKGKRPGINLLWDENGGEPEQLAESVKLRPLI